MKNLMISAVIASAFALTACEKKADDAAAPEEMTETVIMEETAPATEDASTAEESTTEEASSEDHHGDDHDSDEHHEDKDHSDE